MTKKIRKVLLSCLMGMAMLAECYFATESLAADASDVVYITFDQCVAGNDYMMLLLKKGTALESISESNILFIDQIKATGSRIEIGIISPDYLSFDAAMGGVFLDGGASPRKTGSVNIIKMPGQLAVIGEEAFTGGSFTHVYVSENVETIDARAFSDCYSLSYIYIPASVTSIANDILENCSNVTVGCHRNSMAYNFAVEHGYNVYLVD